MYCKRKFQFLDKSNKKTSLFYFFYDFFEKIICFLFYTKEQGEFMKSFKICMYDFRRLILNPITLCGAIIAVVACVIAGFCFKPTVSPQLSLSFEYETSEELYNNFINGSYEDSVVNLDAKIMENKKIIDGQRNTTLIDTYNNLTLNINTFFENLLVYNAYPNDYPDISTFVDNAFDINVQTELRNFYNAIASLKDFESPLYFTEDEMITMKSLADLLDSTLYYTTNRDNVKAMYDVLLEDRQLFRDFLNIEVVNWQTDADKTVELEVNYVVSVEEKLDDILQEFESVYYGSQNLDDMESLALNYKRIVTFANYNMQGELFLLLSKSLPNYANYIGYESQEELELKQNIVQNNYILKEVSQYYTNYLQPMNFNSASGKTNAYDFAYYLISIIGFILIIIGIFFAYKLFGRDRRKGKVDVVLAQNASFNSVFAGKFFAILFATFALLFVFSILIILISYLMYGVTFTPVLAVFNLSSSYVVSPLIYLLFKLFCIEFEIMFYTLITILLMNVSRKFELMFGISLGIFAIAFTLNTFLSGFFVYALFPFVHANLFPYFGGANSSIQFLGTAFISGGNFFISICYTLVLMVGIYFFTNQLFKRN